MQKFNTITSEYLKVAQKLFENVQNKSELDALKATYLGPKSTITQDLKQLIGVEKDKRASIGKQLNTVKNSLEEYYRMAQSILLDTTDLPPLDMSLPGRSLDLGFGHIHPTSQVLSQTYQIFTELGFAIVDSDEIETDWYNFEALNMPPEHPARDMQDTFYIDNGKMNLLPRSHTSGMQVRFMEKNTPPFKIIVPGRVFRNEDEDATHAWIFNQVEGLVVGEGVSMADLKGTLLRVVRGLLGEDVEIRFRASYFPYTEPSVELDAFYQGNWLELGGAGMVHPQVLRNGGIDPDKYSGFAFGWGAERFAVVKYGIGDLRELWRPRFVFLEQF